MLATSIPGRTPALAPALLWAIALSLACSTPSAAPMPVVPVLASTSPENDLALQVDPFIGTANEGQTFPGATRPWGMVSASPHTTATSPATFLSGGLLANAGYVHGEEEIFGFGLTHLSGVGCPDYGAPVIAAIVGDTPRARQEYGSAYDSEQAHAGYYSVHLQEHDIWAEMSATERTGVFRFFFPQSERSSIVIDAAQSLSFTEDEGQVRIVGAREIEGSVGLGQFCFTEARSRLYFVLRLDRDASESGTVQDLSVSSNTSAEGHALAFLQFPTHQNEAVEVQVGVSWVSVEGARRNLDAETEGRDFESVLADASADWQRQLGRVEVEGGSDDDRKLFYTALYHSLLHPNLANDVDGQHLRFGDNAPSRSDDARYGVFSLWDTYRTLHPLLTLLYPERQRAMLRSLAEMSAEAGRPPMWELSGDETRPMVGDPAAIVVADSFAKGVRDFDAEGLYSVLRMAAEDPVHRPGVAEYRALGYVPMDLREDLWGPASTTLEYAVADGALATLAAGLGHADDAQYFQAQSRAFENLFDEETGMLRPRSADGEFWAPFDPDTERGSAQFGRVGGPGYVEGSAWTYAFFAPQDVPTLIRLHGEELFRERLSTFFDTDRFAMWNEPDIAYPYLFTYLAGGWARTQAEVIDARQTFFTTGPGGLPGNDDAGTLSAWYVFSALGFYPVAVGTDEYRLGLPLFERLVLHLDPADQESVSFVIERGNATTATEALLDAEPMPEPALSHRQIMEGGTLRFE